MLIFLTASCSSVPYSSLPDIPGLANQPEYDIPDVDLLALTPAMKAFVESHSEGDDHGHGAAWSLAYASMNPYVFDFDYDSRITLPADAAFEKRIGNCLSFSAMFIAMAREAGMTAYFQEVDIPPAWMSVEDNLLVGKHINAVVVDEGYKFTVDVSRRKSREVEKTRRLSDTAATAQYYSNLGVDALIAKDNALAYAYFRKGLETDLRQDYIWTNLAVILRRNGQTEDAIMAYRTALELNPDQTVALNNLHVIYTEDGNLAAAEEIRARVEKTRRKNPYYFRFLAETAIEEQRYSDAIELASKAINMDPEEYLFYYTLARSQYRAGRIDEAWKSLAQASELAPDPVARDALVLPGEDY